MHFQQLPHTYRSSLSTGKLSYVARFFLKNTLSCSSANARTHVADENLVYGGWVGLLSRLSSLYSDVHSQTPSEHPVVRCGQRQYDRASLFPPWLLGIRGSCSDPVDQKPAAAFLADIIYEARNSLPSQRVLPSYLKVDS